MVHGSHATRDSSIHNTSQTACASPSTRFSQCLLVCGRESVGVEASGPGRCCLQSGLPVIRCTCSQTSITFKSGLEFTHARYALGGCHDLRGLRGVAWNRGADLENGSASLWCTYSEHNLTRKHSVTRNLCPNALGHPLRSIAV